MDVYQIESILREIKYPGFEFYISQAYERRYMQAMFLDARKELQHTRKWYISYLACKNEIVQTAMKLVLTAVEHEAREMFTYKGKKIFGPHYDVDVLAEVCGKDANLDYRR